MAWVKKSKYRSYYYRSIYVGGKVFTHYCGSGEQGRKFEDMYQDLSKAKRLSRRKPADPTDRPAASAG